MTQRNLRILLDNSWKTSGTQKAVILDEVLDPVGIKSFAHVDSQLLFNNSIQQVLCDYILEHFVALFKGGSEFGFF